MDKLWTGDMFKNAIATMAKKQKEHQEFCDMVDKYIQSTDLGQNECDDILYVIKGAHKLGKWGIEIQEQLLHSDTHEVLIDLGFSIKIDGNNTSIIFKKEQT